MNGFLVLLCHTMDDLPVGLFATREQAEECAASLDPEPTPYLRKLFKTDCSTPSVVRIVEFTSTVPVAMWLVKRFDE